MRARRSDLTVTPGGALLLAAALFFLDDETLLSLAVSAAVHEAGHFFALTALGAGVEHIRLTLTGLEIAYAPATLSYGDEAVCALTGPAFGAAAAFLFSAFGLYTAAGVSALLTAFNLLPVYPLDGGRALLALASLMLGPDGGARAAAIVSLAVSAALTAAGVLVPLGAVPAIIGLWLTYRTCKNLRYGVE